MALAKLTMTREEILGLASTRRSAGIDRATLVASAIRMKDCNLMRFLKIKQGMSRAAKNDALDAALQRWVDCLKRH